MALLKHGDTVGVIDVRRRFVKIRTSRGAEGWVDAAELLSREEMEQLRRERERDLTLPPQGAATAYESLNVHIEPSRSSPAFTQIPEGSSVEVLSNQAAPKLNGPRKPTLLVQRPPPPARKPRKDRQARSSRLPVPPDPPKPPENWREIWGVRENDAESGESKSTVKETASTNKEPPPKPLVMESWTLVRTRKKEVGWVLSGNLMMSIPDEVAQYAEGKRITSYFSLGVVNDEEKGIRHDWLWTTASSALPYNYDGWRVFLWNHRRHRYETSYRQHDVEGYFPVHVNPADDSSTGRTFELVTKDDDGKFRRRTYSFDGVRVHLTATEDYNPRSQGTTLSSAAVTEHIQPKAPRSGLFKRAWSSLKQRFHSGSAD